MAVTERPTPWPVVYRAMWNDDRPGLHELAAQTFRAWARSRHPQLEVAEGESGAGDDSERVRLRRDTAAGGGVSETLLELAQQSAQVSSSVLLRVLTSGPESWLWVDVEMPPAEVGPSGVSGVQELVCDLIDSAEGGGGRTSIGGERVGTRVSGVRPDQHIVRPVVDYLRNPSRRLPCVVLAHDYLDGPGPTMERARVTARRLAGLARVYLLPAPTIVPFQTLMGSDLDVEPGTARLYLPGEHEPHRHRILAREVVSSDTNATARWFGRLLQSLLVDREPPDLYRRAHQLIGDRREQSEAAADSDLAAQVESLEAEIESVWAALYQAREDRAAVRAERDEQAGQLIDAVEELELAQQRNEALQEQLKSVTDRAVQALLSAGSDPGPTASDPSVRTYGAVTSIRQAIDLARDNLQKVEFPRAAEERISDLDNAVEARSWARSVLDGLLALEAYAHSGADYGDFRDWCLRSDHPRKWFGNAKKLGMKESEEVMRQPELRKHRMLPVSSRLEPEGRIEMQAHLKLANGSLAPRLYFYDDTEGDTGKVHVGYLGPHLPTKRFRT